MIDINLIRTNPDLVRENIKKKFQDAKLVLVDEVIALDKENREAMQRGDALRAQRNKISKQIGMLMGKGQKEEAEEAKKQVSAINDELLDLEKKEEELAAEIKKRMMVIPNIIDASVPIGKDDSENVENERFGEPVVPDFEVPYHVDIMEKHMPFRIASRGVRSRTSCPRILILPDFARFTPNSTSASSVRPDPTMP